MRLALFLSLLALILVGCAPQADGPPIPQQAAPEPTAPAGGGTALPSGHPTVLAVQEPGALPSGHPAVTPGQLPSPRHGAAQDPREIRQTQGTVVSVTETELILALASGSQLRFHLPQGLKVQPGGAPVTSLKSGDRIKVGIRPLEQGMEAASIELF
ncbi:MAG TPA: hypothetical protein VNO81_04945 [Candidatus Nitrosotenuis sp.]|jgi:hypothetical protein|nr:hypothetical protein [Candidatus Nitrosotenuis sp.]